MSSIFRISYQVVPCDRQYYVFLQQALKRAHYLPSHYQIVPILFCDLRQYDLNAHTLIVDSNGDLWYSNHSFEYLSQNILQDQHLFVPFNTCLGSPLWLNLRYCSYFNTLEDESNHQTIVKYGFFYYQLNTHRNLAFIYPLSIRFQSLCVSTDPHTRISSLHVHHQSTDNHF